MADVVLVHYCDVDCKDQSNQYLVPVNAAQALSYMR